MSCIKVFLVFWGLFVISTYHAFGQNPLPILKLYDLDLDNVNNISGCKDGLINNVDYFTVRGKVNKNGSDPDVYLNTNLCLLAVNDSSTQKWTTQCQPDLTVCGGNLNTDCYCERKDADGYYHLVMTIKVKSIYSGGALMLSWNDKCSPYNQTVLSNVVDYYSGTINEQKNVTLQLGSTEITLDTDPSSDMYKNLYYDYTPDMTNLTFCVYNLIRIGSIQLVEREEILVQTTTDPCVSIPLNQSQSRDLNMTFTESGGCERTGLYTLRLALDAETESGLEDYKLVFIVLFYVLPCIWLTVILICCFCPVGGNQVSPGDDNDTSETDQLPVSDSVSTSKRGISLRLFATQRKQMMLKKTDCSKNPIGKDKINAQDGCHGKY